MSLRVHQWKMPNDIDLSLSDVDTMAKELENFARAGGSLLVDASTADFGDNAHLRLEISQKAGVPVVGTVGFGQKEHTQKRLKQQRGGTLCPCDQGGARRLWIPEFTSRPTQIWDQLPVYFS